MEPDQILTKEDLEEIAKIDNEMKKFIGMLRYEEKQFLKRFKANVTGNEVNWGNVDENRMNLECRIIRNICTADCEIPHETIIFCSIQAIAKMRPYLRGHLSDRTRSFFGKNADLKRFMGFELVF